MRNLLLLVLLILSACRFNQSMDNEGHKVEIFKNKLKLFNYKSIRAIPLETVDGKLLGQDIMIKISGKNYYIADLTSNRLVYVFNESGMLLNSIGKVGKGPKEYISLADFSVHGDTIDVLSPLGKKSFIIGYKLNGDFLYKKTFDVISSSIEKMGSYYYFYTSYNKQFNDHRIVITNESGDVKEVLLKNNTNFKIPISEHNFYRNSNAIYVKDAFDAKVFKIMNQQIGCNWYLDMGNYSIPPDFYEKSLMEGFDELNENGFANIFSYIENENMAVFEIYLQKQGEETQKINCIVNKVTNEIVTETEPCLNNLVGFTDNNEVVFCVYPDQLINNKDKFSKLPIINPEAIKDLEVMDNPILFTCKIED